MPCKMQCARRAFRALALGGGAVVLRLIGLLLEGFVVYQLGVLGVHCKGG